MIEAYTRNGSGIAVASNTPITFITTSYSNGCSVSHIDGSNTFVLRKAGLYQVDFNGFFSASSTSVTSISIQMTSNGSNVPQAISAGTSTSTTDVVPLSFTCLVKVSPSCCAVDNKTTLSFINTNADLLYNANVVIKRLG